MAEIKLKDFVDDESLKKLHELDDTIAGVAEKYKTAASELLKGLKLDVQVKGDVDKLISIYNMQSKDVAAASGTLTDALRKQTEIAGNLSSKLEELGKSRDLDAKQAKEVAKASAEVSKSLQQTAKAEEALHKAEKAAQSTRRKANVTEQERKKIIEDALKLTEKDIHSKHEAKEANKELRRAADLLKDTDEDYAEILGKLNSTIDVNTSYIKRNSDQYTQQKMTVGGYREEIKHAWMELQTGSNKMKNMGIIANDLGGILKSRVSSGFREVSSGVSDMVRGFVGAQAVIGAFQKLLSKIGEGFSAIVSFEAANSKLAAILGTTSDGMKELTTDARRLGAETKYTASQATELQIELSKLGFTKTEILQSTEAVLKFAQATGSELGEAASLAGAAIRMFGATTKEMDRYVSAMAVSTSRSALSFSYLATALPIVGPVAKSFNFTIEDTLALVGKLADAGFDASMAATATRNIFLNLADSGGKLAKALGKPVANINDLVSGLISLRDKGIDLNTTLELTDKRSVAAFNAFLTSADKVSTLREQITGVSDELTDMADTMANNVQGAIYGLDSAWEAFMLSFYGSKGKMKEVIDFFTRGIRYAADQLKDFEQKQAEADNKAASEAQKELSESDYLKKNVDNMKRLYDEKIKAGMSSEKAEKAAKDEYIQSLRSRLEQENKEYEKAIAKRKELEEELNGRGFWETLTSWKRTNNVIEGEIKDAVTAAAGKRGLAAITESVIGDLENTNLTGRGSGEKTDLKSLTDEQMKAIASAEAELQESKVNLMKEGYEKEVASIRAGYEKRINTIKGENSAEIELRKSLQAEMEKKLAEAYETYSMNRTKTDLENRLSTVRQGSDEELALRLQILETQRLEEVRSAEAAGADLLLVDAKYAKMRSDILAEYADADVQRIAENASVRQMLLTSSYTAELRELEKMLAQKKITREEYDNRKGMATEKYSVDTARGAVETLEKQISVEDISFEQREELMKRLAEAKEKLANAEADAEIDSIKRIEKAEEESYKKRVKNAQQWLQVAGDMFSSIADLASSMMDGDIQGIEKQQSENEEAAEKEMERIQMMEEQGVITKEQAEARKRAAEDKTAKKNKELEEQKVKIQEKQAKWDKANSIIQAGIATALAITRALPNLILAGIVGAMGAVQIATIAAAPIPAYAEGTRDRKHPGGLAVVGDGGRQEIVVIGKNAWITPDRPTVVDLPKGAEVFPDYERFERDMIPPTTFGEDSSTVVVNDYSGLERKTEQTNELLRRLSRQIRKKDYRMNYERYKNSII